MYNNFEACKISNSEPPLYMTAENIKTTHAFTTRYGGVSTGAFCTLNLGLSRGDDPERVLQNYEIICQKLNIEPQDIICSQQVHGCEVRVITDDDPKVFCRDSITGIRVNDSAITPSDAMITSQAGIALMVFIADCVPVLLHDPILGAVGAVHAGWRGTVLDIAGKTVLKMNSQFGSKPSDIRAAIGPCIDACCFETGGEVALAVRDVLCDNAEEFISRRGDKFMINLKAINRQLLIRAGVLAENIQVSDECTFCSSDKYWSHRRTNGVRGSQAAIIKVD